MDLWKPMKQLKKVTKTANSRGNESRIAKQDSKKFPQIVETANGKLANGEGCLNRDFLDGNRRRMVPGYTSYLYRIEIRGHFCNLWCFKVQYLPYLSE